MAGGGIPEAMLIGAAVGAGTGGIMSAAQDKDPLEGALLGAAMGAAGGGIGSWAGGAASGAQAGVGSSAVPGAVSSTAPGAGVSSLASGTPVWGNVGGSAVGEVGGFASGAGGTLGGGAGGGGGGAVSGTVGGQGGGVFGTVGGEATGTVGGYAGGTGGGAGGATGGGANWGAQGLGEGFAPALTNAQAYGAGIGGGITGLIGQSAQNQNNMAPEPEEYTGPLSQFKYNPQTFRPSVAPGYADGGIASLGPQTGMYPQSQMDRTQFAVPSQMPVSREVIGSDYDARISPYTGDIPRYAGGGIGFVRTLQPGGEFGAAQADIYGAQQNLKPDWLQRAEPGGFIGATVPGKMDYEDKQRAEAQAAADQQAILEEEDRKKKMWSNFVASRYGMSEPNASIGMASGGISSLGSYSDGGRMLRGPGDGMSDDIPGVIAGKQPARLADGEFVVPADVVSHLGNGSTDAGAKKLYSMMDNVRKARTGTKKQGKQIKAEKHMPGMKHGGIAHYEDGGETEAPLTRADLQAAINSARATPAGLSTGFQPTGYMGTEQQYTPYTMANRPSSTQPQFYGNIYQGSAPDYSSPGYTLAGNLGRWSNVTGESQRATQPASMAQQVTQSYLSNLGRAPETEGFNNWMGSGLTAPEIQQAISQSPEAFAVMKPINEPIYLQNKLNQLRDIGYQGDFTGNTPQELKDFMASIGMTPQQHYQQFGRAEGVSPYETVPRYDQQQSQPAVEQQVSQKALEKSKEQNAEMKRRGGIASLVRR